MKRQEDTHVLFTAESPERIILEGESREWVLNPARAKQCTWLVCTQNRNNPDHEFSDATEPHGSAFLLGKVSGVRRAPAEGAGTRWIVAISEYARIEYPDLWDHSQNPVRYRLLEELGISLEGLTFQPVRAIAETSARPEPRPSVAPPAMLTIPEAKKALAATFGVTPEAVEIMIRG